MKLFFDTSALVKRYIDEAGSDEVESLCGEAREIAVSIVYPIEAISAFSRLRREKHITAAQYETIKTALFNDLSDMDVVDIDSSTVKHSVHAIESYPLKALDAIHVTCAVQWQPDFFVSGDTQQADAARGMGLKAKLA